MNIKLHLNKQPSLITFSIRAKKPAGSAPLEGTPLGGIPLKLNFTGFSLLKNTVFFERDVYASSGLGHFQFPMPITPDKLFVQITSLSSGSYKLVQTKIKPLATQIPQYLKVYQPTSNLFKEFAYKAGFLNTGIFQSKGSNKQFIVYLPQITDQKTGAFLDTPARVHMGTGIIEVSQQHFKKYTVAMRMFILCHEFSHILQQTYDEYIADRQALIIYLGLHFPATEAMYSLARLMDEDPQFDEDRKEALEEFEQEIRFADEEEINNRMAAMNDYVLNYQAA